MIGQANLNKKKEDGKMPDFSGSFFYLLYAIRIPERPF
jgi:hypothetical protein